MPSKRLSTKKLTLAVLDPPQRKLWRELGQTPPQFTLYGGTALALRLGHRKSVDFDFFTVQPFDPSHLRRSIGFLAGAQVLQLTSDTLTCVVDRGGPVQVSFFAPPTPLRMIGRPYDCRSPRVRLASLIDIAATKLNVLTHRASARDYIDVHALLTIARLDLPTMLAAVPCVFDDVQFNPSIILKALSYHGDAEVSRLPAKMRRELIRAVAAFDFDAFQSAVDRYQLNPDAWENLP